MAMANIRESYNDINVVMRTRNVSKRDSNRLKLSIPFLKVTSKLVGKISLQAARTKQELYVGFKKWKQETRHQTTC